MEHFRKLEWARKHLATLEGEIADFRKKDPFSLRMDVQRDANCIRVFVDVHHAMPHEWPLLIGDIVHNMRSSLDHIVYALSIKNPTPPIGIEARQIQFPICEDAGEYFGTKGKRGQRERRARFLAPKALAQVDGAQPHLAGSKAHLHILAVLSGLSNEDKHRNILIAAVAGDIPLMQMIGVTQVQMERLTVEMRECRLEQDTEIAYVGFPDGMPDGNVNVDPHLTFEVQFDYGRPGYGADVLYTLKAADKFIGDQVLPALGYFL